MPDSAKADDADDGTNDVSADRIDEADEEKWHCGVCTDEVYFDEKHEVKQHIVREHAFAERLRQCFSRNPVSDDDSAGS